MKTIMRFFFHRFSLLVALLVLCPAALPGQEKKVILGLTTRTGSTGLPFAIAEEKGFFRSEGLDGLVDP
ncbi:MAG: hypothetical protein HYY83_08785, partial [Deltaproteobacteria bacterium]|nr:hypothetical protein [Deltaproteobacteria bacterium]